MASDDMRRARMKPGAAGRGRHTGVDGTQGERP